ncbi:tyrosine/nicotianamine aminotransferase, Pyridoxal phosphate-dependent transferase [Artemisia annua]|uniref:Tyrosine/nicotianamine aminotransferase, Pyridoxal phosphate-dependent transferase n=1 Tax=Artemisia annua TaxID=35608 RepID=A0A2U1KCQ8_ARTAN|nr:tyrosine/nicotianamine aminotransferase, Pyridoxal phosphate-dependent transferase [Artemisia annua]
MADQEPMNINENPTTAKPLIQLGYGDPSLYPCFRTSTIVEDALVEAIQSAQHNCYAPSVGINPARRAVAEYLSKDIPYKLSTDDVFLTVGAEHAIHVLLTVLARPGANILLPRPNYPTYEARAKFSSLEVRHFDLLPEKGWEVDIDRVKALKDAKTVAIVLVNPGNPCGNVFTFEHMKKIAETARQLGIMVISDEVYAHQVFGEIPFTPMGVFGDIVPVVTLGTLSKRWIIPGWRFGWIAITDPKRILYKTGIVDSIKSCLVITGEPPTVIQGAVPSIMKNTPDSFFMNINKLLKDAADMVYERLKEIPLVTCPHKPDGSMFVMVKLNLSTFVDVVDDTDFCMKLAKEESMILLPGNAVGLKNWVRMSFAAEPKVLKKAIERMKAFCLRHTDPPVCYRAFDVIPGLRRARNEMEEELEK